MKKLFLVFGLLSGVIYANTCPKWLPIPFDGLTVVVPIYDQSITDPDLDCDGVVDTLDTDIDGDGVPNAQDPYPRDPNRPSSSGNGNGNGGNNNSTNTPPVAQDQNISTAFEASTNVTLSASDVDGDSLSYTITQQPQYGTITLTVPTFTYTPNSGFSGVDTIGFIANDGKADSNEAYINITVQPAPDTTSPTVVSTSPDNNVSNISIYTYMQARFSESIKPFTVNTNNFTLRNHLDNLVSAQVGYTDSNHTATLTPDQRLKLLSPYSLFLSTDIMDIAGNRLVGGHQWNFVTQDGIWDANATRLDHNDTNFYYASDRVQTGMDNKGNIVVAWTETSTFNRYYTVYVKNYIVGQGWSSTKGYVTTSGTPIPMALSVNDNGDALVVWQGNNDIEAAHYNASTKQWSATPAKLSVSTRIIQTTYPWGLRMSNSGDGVLFINDTYGYIFVYTASTDSWSSAISLSQNFSQIQDAKIDSNRTVHILWELDKSFQTNSRLGYSTYDINGSTQSPATYIDLNNQTNPQYTYYASANLEIAPSGMIGVLWKERNYPLQFNTKEYIEFRTYNPKTQIWGTEYRLDNNISTDPDYSSMRPLALRSDASQHFYMAWNDYSQTTTPSGHLITILKTRTYNSKTDTFEPEQVHDTNTSVLWHTLLVDETGNQSIFFQTERTGNTSTLNGTGIYQTKVIRYNKSTAQWSQPQALTPEADDFSYDAAMSHSRGEGVIIYKTDSLSNSLNKVYMKRFRR